MPVTSLQTQIQNKKVMGVIKQNTILIRQRTLLINTIIANNIPMPY